MLYSNQQDFVRAMTVQIGQRSFLCHRVHGLDQSSFVSLFKAEEQKYTKHVVRPGPFHLVPRGVNIVSSHKVCKVKVDGYDLLQLIVKIAPHRKENFHSMNLRSNCCICSSTCMRGFLTVAVLQQWRTMTIDAEITLH